VLSEPDRDSPSQERARWHYRVSKFDAWLTSLEIDIGGKTVSTGRIRVSLAEASDAPSGYVEMFHARGPLALKLRLEFPESPSGKLPPIDVELRGTMLLTLPTSADAEARSRIGGPLADPAQEPAPQVISILAGNALLRFDDQPEPVRLLVLSVSGASRRDKGSISELASAAPETAFTLELVPIPSWFFSLESFQLFWKFAAQGHSKPLFEEESESEKCADRLVQLGIAGKELMAVSPDGTNASCADLSGSMEIRIVRDPDKRPISASPRT